MKCPVCGEDTVGGVQGFVKHVNERHADDRVGDSLSLDTAPATPTSHPVVLTGADWPCLFCGKSFRAQRHRNQHQKRMHREQEEARRAAMPVPQRKRKSLSLPLPPSPALHKKQKLAQTDCDQVMGSYIQFGKQVHSFIKTHRDHICRENTKKSYCHRDGGSGACVSFNFPLLGGVITPEQVEGQLEEIFAQVSRVFRLQLGVSRVLRHNTTGALMFFRCEHDASPGLLNQPREVRDSEGRVISSETTYYPYRVTTHADLADVANNLFTNDVNEALLRVRPNTNWELVTGTNVRYYVRETEYPLNMGAGRGFPMPDWLKNKRSMVALHKPLKGRGLYNDCLCFFRALAYVTRGYTNIQTNAKLLAWHWLFAREGEGFDVTAEPLPAKPPGDRLVMAAAIREFEGITMDDLPHLEQFFHVNICIYTLKRGKRERCNEVYRSDMRHPKTMYLNLFGDLSLGMYHLMPIVNYEMYAKSYSCNDCKRYFPTLQLQQRHTLVCHKLPGGTAHKFPGGFYKVGLDLFQRLYTCNYAVPRNWFTHRFIVYDFEAMLVKNRGCGDGGEDVERIGGGFEEAEETGQEGKKTQWTHRHVPVSVALGCNLPDQDVVCLVNRDPRVLVRDMVQHMLRYQELIRQANMADWRVVLDSMDRDIAREEEEAHREAEAREEEAQDEDDPAPPAPPPTPTPEDESAAAAAVPDEPVEQPADLEDGIFLPDPPDSDNSSDSSDDNDDANFDDIVQGWPRLPQPSRWSEKWLKQLKELREEAELYLSTVPVLGYNSARYDLNLIKKYLMPYLLANYCKINKKGTLKGVNVIKQGGAYTRLEVEGKLLFLDLIKFGPGVPLSTFLKEQGTTEAKFFFPYEWLDSYLKLDATELPPSEAFRSTLRNTNTLGESEVEVRRNYQLCLDVWEREGMETMRDFLIYYNTLDVRPLISAVTNWLREYHETDQLDVLKRAVGVPGVARLLMYREAAKEPGYMGVGLMRQVDADLEYTIKKNLVGGPSIVFSREQVCGETLLKGGPHTCQSIVGYDANALYTYCLMQDMPMGVMVRYTKGVRPKDLKAPPEPEPEPELVPDADGDIIPARIRPPTPEPEPPCDPDSFTSSIAHHSQSRLAMAWLIQRPQYKHLFNTGVEARIGPFRVDGVDEVGKEVVEINGCRWHGHQCLENRTEEDELRYQNTLARAQFIQDKCPGWKVRTVWGCQVSREDSNETLPPFFRAHRYKTLRSHDLLDAVKSGDFFGILEVDIYVPGDVKDQFKEMSPIFVTCDVPFEVIGPTMQQYAREHGYKEKPVRQLVGGMHAEKVLLSSDLLSWYLNHGLDVYNVYQAAEWTRGRPFERFMQSLVDGRRECTFQGLTAKAKKFKLLGNSSYGGCCLNKDKHSSIRFVDDEGVRVHHNNPLFKKSELVTDRLGVLGLAGEREGEDQDHEGVDQDHEGVDQDHTEGDGGEDQDHGVQGCIYEVEMGKKSQKHDIPVQIAFMILQQAKKRMLEFYYDCLAYYIPTSKFELIQMDTDSNYIAIGCKVSKPVLAMQAELLRKPPGYVLNEAEMRVLRYHPLLGLIEDPYLRRQMRNNLIGHCCADWEILPHVHFFVRQCCVEHYKHDLKTPGLFKLEAWGEHGLALSSKTYAIQMDDGSEKIGTKGAQRGRLEPNGQYERMKGVLDTGDLATGTNVGFRVKDGLMHTYQQCKSIYNFMYTKRKVLPDGRSTEPLDLILRPWGDQKTLVKPAKDGRKAPPPDLPLGGDDEVRRELGLGIHQEQFSDDEVGGDWTF